MPDEDPEPFSGWLFFSHALILNKNPHLWIDTKWIVHAVYIRCRGVCSYGRFMDDLFLNRVNSCIRARKERTEAFLTKANRFA